MFEDDARKKFVADILIEEHAIDVEEVEPGGFVARARAHRS